MGKKREPGNLRHRVLIPTNVVTGEDSLGAEIVEESMVERWGNVVPAAARESFGPDRVHVDATHVIEMRDNDLVKTDMALQANGRTYNVTGVVRDRTGFYMDVFVTERDGDS